MQPLLKTATLFTVGCAFAAATGVHAETVFLLNNTSPKTLLSNESDGAALDGAKGGTVTPLALSADDGGGAINLTTVDVSGNNSLFMDGDSMGHANDKWGANQNWTFMFDQTISFDALRFKTINENMTLKSSAWLGDADATGSNWSFSGATGQFTILGSNGPGTYDFTTAGVSNVAAGTEIGFGFFASAAGGEELTSLTITPTGTGPIIPTPSAMLLGVVGLGGLALRRRRG